MVSRTIPPCTVSRRVEDAIRLLDHLGIERAHVVGYSMGGALTHELRANHADRLLTATFGGIGWSSESPFDREALANALEHGSLEPLIRALTPVGQPQPSAAQIEATNAAILGNNDAIALAALIRASRPPIPEQSLRANQVPSIALIGEVDPIIRQVEIMAGVMDNLEVVVIEGADHATAVAHSKFIDSLLAFLARH